MDFKAKKIFLLNHALNTAWHWLGSFEASSSPICYTISPKEVIADLPLIFK
jgi:hypothetical protein